MSGIPMEKQLNQKLGFYLRHPQLVPYRIRNWVWERSHPEAPWLCRGTITFAEQHFRGLARGLEFGSGRSTVWLAGWEVMTGGVSGKGAMQLVSLEKALSSPLLSTDVTAKK